MSKVELTFTVDPFTAHCLLVILDTLEGEHALVHDFMGCLDYLFDCLEDVDLFWAEFKPYARRVVAHWDEQDRARRAVHGN